MKATYAYGVRSRNQRASSPLTLRLGLIAVGPALRRRIRAVACPALACCMVLGISSAPDGMAMSAGRGGSRIFFESNSGALQSMSASGALGPTYTGQDYELAMASNGNQFAGTDIFQGYVDIASLDGSSSAQISDAAEPAWSPSAVKIAFVYQPPGTIGCTGRRPRRMEQSADADPYGIWVANADGTGIRQLTSNDYGCGSSGDFDPVWSPDGSSIAFIRESYSETGCATHEHIYTMSATGSKVTQVSVGGNADDAYSSLSWSSAGFAFTRANVNATTCSPGKADVYVVSGAGGTPKDVSSSGLSDENWVDWSPDGSELVVDNTKAQIATLAPDGHSAEDVIGKGYFPNWIGTTGCTPPRPKNVAAVSGANFARIHWAHPSGNGCPITGYVISGGKGAKSVGPSTTGTDIYGLKPHHPYTFTVSSRGAFNDSVPVAANTVTPSEPNHPCPGNDAKRSDVYTDGNEAGNTFWRAESDIIWCNRFDVATFESVQPTSYTAWTDKIGFSWLAGPAADEIKQVLGYSITPASGYVSGMSTEPSATWPTRPGQKIQVTTYPGFEIHDDLLTTALFAVAAIGGGADPEESLAEEIEKEKSATKVETFFAKHQSKIDKELSDWLEKKFDKLAGSHSSKLKHLLGHQWKKLIVDLADRLVDRLINVIGDPIQKLVDKFLGKLLAALHKHSTITVPVYGKQVATISPHGKVTAKASIPLFPLHPDTYVKKTKSGH